MVSGIIPLVRFGCAGSIKLARDINPSFVVVPIYDLISSSNAKPNELFRKIKRLGGFHNALDYHGVVILSSIMKDNLIKKFELSKYAEIINELKPDFYFTPDGLTYERKDSESLRELVRISSLTSKLIEMCPHSRPIGLVKGSDDFQIKEHKNFLKRLGVKVFAFHTSDFFRQGDNNMIQKAKHYCSIIKDEENTLLLYGLGFPRRMLEFSFADLFITNTHFVNAKHRKRFVGARRETDYNKSVYELALHNFKEISNYLKKLKYQTKLFSGGKCKWAEELQEQLSIIRAQKVNN
jgi:hypothetical protein